MAAAVLREDAAAPRESDVAAPREADAVSEVGAAARKCGKADRTAELAMIVPKIATALFQRGLSFYVNPVPFI